ncbi:two-component system sensor histidine kinase NtrB [Desulforhopalus sp. 52FAK]
MKGLKVNKIAGTLVFWLVVVSSSLTLIGTATELYFDYQAYLNRLSQRVGEVTEHQLPEIQRFIAAGDAESVGNVLQKMLGVAPIAYAAVIVENEVTWEKGNRGSRYEVVASQPFWVNQQKVQNAAVLKVATDISPVRDYIYQKFLHSLVTNGIKIFLIAAFVFLMFQFLVTRHLQDIARQIQGQDITKSTEPIVLERRDSYQGDELDQVVTDLNVMREKAHDALTMLEKNEERLLLFFDSTEEAIVGVSRDGNCSFVNDSCMEMLGLVDYETVIGKPLSALFVHKEFNSDMTSSESEVISSSMEFSCSTHSDEGYLNLPSKTLIPVSLRSYPVFQDGEVSGAIIFIKNNSEKRQLMHERELLSQAVEQSPVMIVIADDQNAIEYVNPGTVRWSGYSKYELLGNSLFSFVTLSPEATLTVQQLEQQLKNGQKWEGVIRTNSKWGASVSVYCVISPVFDLSHRIINTIAVCKEVSYEAALQDELLNSKKMEAVGRLSASFAHEFGNPLFGVRSVIKDISERLQLSPEDAHLLQLANVECDKMRNMVREFQDVYLESTSDEVYVGINSIVEDVLREYDLLFTSEKIQCDVELQPELEGYRVSKNKLTLVVRNIISNSVDAMLQRGGELKVTGRLAGEYINLCICDNGSGIKSELQELVFEPFFSTKPEVEGAGLGLSVAYGTMTSLGGTITFSSVPGRGACFSVQIPTRVVKI